MASPNFINFNSDSSKRVSFEIHDVDLSVVNALRRVILTDIPNVAIAFDPYNSAENDITFISNTSSLHNEFMGHRISLIPVNLSLDDIDTYDSSKYRFILNVKNQSNTTIDVTTKDIQVLDANGNVLSDSLKESLFPPCEITKDHILITRLKPNPFNNMEGEELNCEFYARSGVGKAHARWSHVSLCSFTNKVDEVAADDALATLKKSLDASLTDEERNRAINRFNTIERHRIFMKNKYDEPSQFRFTLEVINDRVSPVHLFTRGFDALINMIHGLNAPEKMQCHCLNPSEHMFMLHIKNEGHTVGNLLQSMIYNRHVRDSGLVQYVGYYQPHPLENDIVLKIRSDSFNNNQDVYTFMNDMVGYMTKHLSDLRNMWNSMHGISHTEKPQTMVQPQQKKTSKPLIVKKKTKQ